MPYSEAEITSKLSNELPQWTYTDGMIQRVYQTHGWALSQTLFGLISHLAEAACHHPDVLVTYPSVTVKLTTHDAGGVSDKDFELALQIEQLAVWVPGDDSALDGYVAAYKKPWVE